MDFKNLIIIREKNELSQRQIAKILGISKSTYARWETKEQIISLSHLNDFCQAFHVSMDYLLSFDTNNKYTRNDYTKKIDKEIIGNNIKSIRKKHKLTQKDLADIFNTSQSTISAYESGKTLVLTPFAYSICKHFNFSLDKLCDRTKEKIKINS